MTDWIQKKEDRDQAKIWAKFSSMNKIHKKIVKGMPKQQKKHPSRFTKDELGLGDTAMTDEEICKNFETEWAEFVEVAWNGKYKAELTLLNEMVFNR